MKKIVFATVSALALAAIAADSTQFGVLTVVNSGARRTLVAIPWCEASTSSSEIAVSNLVLTANLAENDTLDAIGTNGTSLCQWTLTKGTDDVLYWKAPDKVVSGDNQVSDGEQSDAVTIKRGSAVVLLRKSGDLTKPFYVMGQVANSDPTATIVAGTSTKPCYNMIAPPSTEAQCLNGGDHGATWDGVDANDRIYISLASGFAQELKYDTSAKVWKNKSVVDDGTFLKTSWVQYDTPIPVGTGFWYVSRGGSPTVTWKDVPKTTTTK